MDNNLRILFIGSFNNSSNIDNIINTIRKKLNAYMSRLIFQSYKILKIKYINNELSIIIEIKNYYNKNNWICK